MLAYIFQMLLCSAILYGYYHLFLRNGRFHQYNRFYLLGSIVVSLLLPLIKIPVTIASDEVIYQSLTDFSSAVTVVYKRSPAVLTASTLLTAIYIIVALTFFLRIVLSIRKILRLKNTNPSEELNDVVFIQTSHPDTPFSFFKWLFWNREIELNSDKGRHIFRHEMYHIEKKHSWDLVFTEVVAALFWFNPIFYLIRREVKIIQEFLADQYATNHENVSSYAELLLMQTLKSYQHRLVNPFFHNQLKRRIAMLTKSKKPAYQYLRKLMVLPLAAVATLLFAFTYNKEIKEVEATINKKIESATKILAPVDRTAQKQLSPVEEVSDTVPQKNTAKEAKTIPFRYYTEQKTYERLPEAVVVSYYKDAPKVVRPHETTVDIEASFPGGAAAWLNFLERNVKASIPTDNGARPGKYNTAVRFIVEPDGSLSNFEPLTDYGFGMEDEVIRVLKKSEKWKPALNNKSGDGKEVRAYRIQTIQFQVLILDQEKYKIDNASHNAGKAESETEIFTKVEQDPSYPGGDIAWRSFLERNLKGEVPVENRAAPGTYTTIIQFIVDKDGNVSDVKPLTKLGYGMEEEAMRVIKKSGKWKPAEQNGRVVKSYIKKPVSFQVVE